MLKSKSQKDTIELRHYMATALFLITFARQTRANTTEVQNLIFVNGAKNVTLNVGDSLTYNWAAPSGSTHEWSTYTQDSPSCGQPNLGPNSWVANSSSGKITAILQPCHARHVYVINYEAADSAGNTVADHVTVTVNRAPQKWRVMEMTLQGLNSSYSSFPSAKVDATFSGPNGESIKRPAYWDHDNVWKIRFAPSSTGAWSYVTTASDPYDRGLNTSGRFYVESYSDVLPVYQHGFVKSQPGHFLTYSDGTPFFWLGVDLWGIAAGRLNQTNKTSWNPTVSAAGQNSQIYGALDRFAQQGFNLVDFSFLNEWVYDQNGVPQIPTSLFKNFYDPGFKYAADKGMTINVTVFFGELNYASLDKLQTMARYLVARYGAYPVVWNVSSPDMPEGTEFAGVRKPAGYINELDSAMGYVASIDGYHHPIGPWYMYTAINQPTNLYLNKSWPSMIISQCGHLANSDGTQNWGGTQLMSTYQYYYANYPLTPMIEAGGCNYTNISDRVSDYVSRRSAWRAVHGGSSGFTYGSDGVYTMEWERPLPQNDQIHPCATPSSPASCHQWQGTPWYIGIEAPSGWQMQLLKNYFQGLPWTQMNPHYWPNSNLIVPSYVTSDLSRPLVRADESMRNISIYFPIEYSQLWPATITGLTASSYQANWYNPQTGAFTAIQSNIVPSNGRWQIPPKPDSNDWTLLIQSR